MPERYIYRDRMYCYLKGEKLLELLSDSQMVDDLYDVLAIPCSARDLKALSLDDKKANILSHLRHLIGLNTSYEHKAEVGDILALAILDGISKSRVRELFHSVRNEAALRDPVAQWLSKKRGCKVYKEVLMGNNTADLVGQRKSGFLRSERIIGVELKNDKEEMRRGLDQLSTYSRFCDEVYLAATPYFCAQYVNWFSTRTERLVATALDEKLKAVKAGLILVHSGHCEVVREAGSTVGDLRDDVIRRLGTLTPIL